MGMTGHKCIGCFTNHDAELWYHREGESDMGHWQEWLCGSKHADLSDEGKGRWRIDEPQLTL
jgi:hypothetical protein